MAVGRYREEYRSGSNMACTAYPRREWREWKFCCFRTIDDQITLNKFITILILSCRKYILPPLFRFEELQTKMFFR